MKAEDQHRTLAALNRAMSSFESNNGYFSARPPKAKPSADDDEEESVSPCLEASRMDFGRVCGKLKQASPCAAKPIRAERLKFPPPPSFSPRGYLDREVQARFDRPWDFEAPLEPPPPVPRVKILADKAQKIALYKALASCGRLRPVRVPPARIPFAGGMFAVPKDLSRDRLVLDARPSNVLGGCPSYWSSSMASASTLLSVVLPPDQNLKIYTADLKDYFYLFKVSSQRLEKNLLHGSLTLAESEDVFGHPCDEFAGPEGRVRVALATLAMGDASAVEFAQGSHVGVLYRRGLLHPKEMLAPNFPPPRGLISIGIVLEQVTKGVAPPSAGRAGARRLDAAYAAYEAAGLLAHPDKGARDVEEGVFWGVKLNGCSGLLRASP